MMVGHNNRRLQFELTSANQIQTLPIRNVQRLSYIEAIVPTAEETTPEMTATMGIAMRVMIDNVQLSDQFVNVAFYHPSSVSAAKSVQHDLINSSQPSISVESVGLGVGESLLVQLVFDGLIGVQ